MSRHESHLASYMRSKKNSSSSLTSRSQLENKTNKKCSHTVEKNEDKINDVSCILSKERKVVDCTRSSQRKANPGGRGKITKADIFLLPDELLLKIFKHLSPSSILICAQVCRRWTVLTKESCLWEHWVSFFPKEVRQLFVFEETRFKGFDWRKETIKRCTRARNTKILKRKKKIKNYTGLPTDIESCLKTLSIVWKLNFVDTRGRQYWISADDVSYFASSLSVRWYSLPIPPIPQLATIAVYACVPVFFNKGWKPHLNSATTKSLTLVHDFKGSFSKETLSSKDEMITAHILPNSLLTCCWEVSWKSGGELAFVTTCLHYNDLLERVLLGSKNKVYQPPSHVPVLDDIDPQYGLHGYSATLELRNHKATYWGRQYRELFQNEIRSDYIILGSYGREHGVFNKQVNLPWKTELFRGILPDMAILDMTILDERKKPMWFVSAPVKVEPITDAEVDYLDGIDGDRFMIDYCDHHGSVHLELVWSADECETALVNVELRILKSFVNSWFGTSY